MKFHKLLAMALVPLLLSVVARAEGVRVTDMKGREIALDAPATRVVALTAADCEILCALGASDALVGRDEYCDYPPEVLSVPSVSSGAGLNVEQVLALEPEAVLMSTMGQTVEQVAQLENAGIKVVVSEATDVEGVYEAIALIGALTGRDEQAAALAGEMRAALDEVAGSLKDDGMTVYFEVSPLMYGLWTAGEGTFMNEIAVLLGLENCFSDVSGWSEVSEEQVLARDPDVIVTLSPYYGEGPTPVEEIASRPGWEAVSAVQSGLILNLANNELTRPGPRLADGARMLRDFVRGGGAE